MALIGSIAIAMTTDTRKFTKGLNVASAQVMAFGRQASNTGSLVAGLFATALAGAGVYAIGKMISGASDLSENINKLDAIFGPFAKDVVAGADEMAAAFGVSKVEFTDAAARLGALLKGAGYGAANASKISVAMVKLATDSASFFNTDFETAFTKIRSGLAGEAEPLRDFGILLSEDAVKAYAYANSIAKMGAELTAGQKTQARLALITKGLSVAQGDLAKTADGVANKTRELWGRVENLAAALGESLLPIAKDVLGQLSIGVQVLAGWWDTNKAAAIDWAKGTVNSAVSVGQGMGLLQKSAGFVADAIHYIRIVWSSVVADFLGGLAKILEGFASVWKYLVLINPMLELLAHRSDLDGMAKQIRAMGEEYKKSFVDEIAKPLPSEGIDKLFEDAQAKADALKSNLTAPIDVSKLKPEAVAEKSKVSGKFASSIAAGSKEDVNLTLRSRYGAGVGNKPAEATAKNTAEMSKKLDTLPAQIGRAIGSAMGGGGAQGTIAALAGSF